MPEITAKLKKVIWRSLDDVVKYGLQLGLYEKMLVDEGFYPEFKGYRKSLIHIRESFGKVVKVENYGDEIEMVMI